MCGDDRSLAVARELDDVFDRRAEFFRYSDHHVHHLVQQAANPVNLLAVAEPAARDNLLLRLVPLEVDTAVRAFDGALPDLIQ
jgi:hypothetical protein